MLDKASIPLRTELKDSSEGLSYDFFLSKLEVPSLRAAKACTELYREAILKYRARITYLLNQGRKPYRTNNIRIADI